MREFQEKRYWRRVVYSWPILILLIILAVLLVGPTVRLYRKNRLAVNEHRLLLEEGERLRERRAQLAAEVEKLNTARGLEEEIREKFNVVKPGERVINLVLPPATTSLAIAPTVKPWWAVILDWFD